MHLNSRTQALAPGFSEQLADLLGGHPPFPDPALMQALAARCETVTAPVAYLDGGLRYRYLNRAYANELGREEPGLVGHSLVGLIGPQAGSAMLPFLQRVLAGEQVRVEAPLLDASGQIRVTRTFFPHLVRGRAMGVLIVGDPPVRDPRTVERLALQQQLSTSLLGAGGRPARAERLLAHCAEFLQADAGVLALVDEERGGGLWVVASFGADANTPVPGRPLELRNHPLLCEAHTARLPCALDEEGRSEGRITSIALPLLVEERALGALELRLSSPRWLDEEDRELLATLSEQGAQSIERARLFDAERRARANAEAAAVRLRVLSAVSRELSLARMESGAVLEALAAALVPERAELCVVHLLAADGHTLEIGAIRHRVPEVERRLQQALLEHPLEPEGTLVGEVMASGVPAMRVDPIGTAWNGAGSALQAVLAEHPVGELLVVPLRLEGQSLGTVSLFTQPDRLPLVEEDLALLQKLADRTIIALGAARAFEAERRARESSEAVREHLEQMHELSVALGGVLTGAGVMRVLVSRGLALIGAASGVGVLPDVDGRTLQVVALAGVDAAPETLRQSLPSDAQLPIAEAYRRGSSFVIEDRADAARRFPELAATGHLLAEGETLVLFPLRTREAVLGVLSFRFDAQHPHSEETLVFLRDLGHLGTLALERAGLYEAQARAVGERDEFLSIASHELRTPLTPLHLKLELLARELTERSEPAQAEKLMVHVQSMRRQVRRMGELVNGMLDLSRIDAGQLVLATSEVELSELVREVVSRHTDEAAQAGCELGLEVEAAGRGRWDRMRLEQVVTNLLTNAFKYGAGRPVMLRVGEDADGAWLCVEDRGIGIQAKEVPRLFQRFARAVSERNYGGLGLGLYITRCIVEAHGGEVSVESTPGLGSRFRVRLPAISVASGRAGAGSAAPGQSP